LPLPEALANYLRYHSEPEAWMLGRFICPTVRLGELAPFAEDIQANRLLSCSALGRGGKSAGGFLASVRADIAGAQACFQRHATTVRFDMLELKLPDDVVSDRAACRQLLAEVRQAVSQSEMEVFFEVPTADPEVLAGVVAELGRANMPWGAG